MAEGLGREKYDVVSVSEITGALLSWARVCTGDVAMPLFCAIDSEDAELTVLQGRLGRPVHPSDSEVDSKEPDPDLPSKAFSAPFIWV